MNRKHLMISLNHAFTVAVLALAIVAFSGCGGKETQAEPEVAVQATKAEIGPIEVSVESDAIVSPLEQAVITPKITSTISKFYVQRGNRVKKGQLLAVLENADLAGAAEQSKGEFQQAEAGYATTTGASLPQQIQKAELDALAAQSAYDAQKKIYDSRKSLFDEGAIPRRDLDSAEVALAQARSTNEQAQKQLADLQRLGKQEALKSATGQLSAAKGKYLNAQAQLSYSEIRSPIDGVVTDRPSYQGELATANQPLLTVMNTSKLIAKAHVAQDEAVLLKTGNSAQIKVPHVDEPIPGRVMLISPALDPGSTTVEVWVETLKPSDALKPGMTVQISATAKKEKDALIVPVNSVYRSAEGGEFVLTAGSDNKAHVINVKTGLRNKEDVQILEGLKAGAQVLTTGGYALPDGTKIKIEVAPAPEAADDKAGDKSGAPAKEKE